MDLLQEYKELYYKEIEFNDRLNNKITTCITFLTILGSAQLLLWTQVKNFELLWYTGVYFTICLISTILFCVCIGLFFRTYSGYKTQLFPIKAIAMENTKILNQIPPEQKEAAKEVLKIKMAERFINDAIHNRELNTTKNNRHRTLIKTIMATFIVTFIAFVINVSIDYHESINSNDAQQIYVEGGELNVR